MRQRMRRGTAAAAIALATVAGTGAAVAAGVRLGSSDAGSKAIVADAAGRLGLEPGELEKALRAAQGARVDAAVAAGRLSQEEGAELKRRIAAGEAPLLAAPRSDRWRDGGRHGGRHGLGTREAAAVYLGLTPDQLRAERRRGTTLAEIAVERGKTVAGLTEAMTTAAEKALAEAVAAGDLTKEREAAIRARLRERIAGLVDGTDPRPGRGWHRHSRREPTTATL